MYSCLLVCSLIVPRLNTRKNRVMAPISIGANFESHTGILLFSMYIGFQFLILFSPVFPHPAGFYVSFYFSFRFFELDAIVNCGNRKNNCCNYIPNHFIIKSMKCFTHIPPAAVAMSQMTR